MQKKYINLLKGIVWQEGNTKGGPESHKVQFDSIVELIL